MLDGTDWRHPPRAALLTLLFFLLHSSVASHFHVHLQEQMPLLPAFDAPPPPPLLSPPILGHLGPLLGNLPSTQLTTSLTRGGYPQDNHRQDGQIQDNLGTQRLSPLGYPGPQPPPFPPAIPPPHSPSGGIRDYSQNQLPQLPQLPHYPSSRPPYLTTFLSYQRPIDAMVDITNELGIVVMQDYAYSRGNFAFSPYGVASILVVLFEAARGDSARQVHAALKLPFDREVVRVGFRDIHRSLRGYFNHEGFLSGVTMSQSRTALLPEFRQVLRFYGYDVDLPADGFEDNPMEPPSPQPTVTLTDTLTGGNSTISSTSTPSKPTSTLSTTIKPASPETTNIENKQQTMLPTSTTIATPSTPSLSTSASPTTPAKSQTEQTTKSEPSVMTTLADELTTKSEIKITTESPTEKTLTDVTAAPSSSGSLSKLVSNPDSSVFSGLLMGSKLQESFNSLFSNGVESRIGDLALSDKKVAMTSPTEASTVTTTQSSELREETTVKQNSNDEILEEIESTQDSSDLLSKVTEMPKEADEAMKVDATTESSNGEVTESPKSLPISDTAESLPLEDRIQDSNIEETTSPRATDSTTAPITTTEPFLAATYIPPTAVNSESPSSTTTLPESKLIDESQRNEAPKENSEVKSRKKRRATKRNAPSAEFKFATELDATTTKNDSYRSRRGIDDLSMQLQNGMFDSHVAHGQELFTQLPRRPFWVDGLVEEMVPVMEYTAAFPYAYIPRLHAFALEFPLDDERYRLLLLLPAERNAASLGQLLRSLARGQAPLRGVMRSLRLTRLHAVVPAFMAEGFVILTPTLQQIGIWDLFDPRRADLSGMTSTPNLYVRNIEQAVTVVVKSYVEILDIQTRTTAARSRTESFVASHPFLYFVMDAETHVALMAGKVVDPLNSRIY